MTTQPTSGAVQHGNDSTHPFFFAYDSNVQTRGNCNWVPRVPATRGDPYAPQRWNECIDVKLTMRLHYGRPQSRNPNKWITNAWPLFDEQRQRDGRV